MASVKGNESNLAGRKPTGKLGGMSDVLAIATDLGYSRFRPPPSQVRFFVYVNYIMMITRFELFASFRVHAFVMRLL